MLGVLGNAVLNLAGLDKKFSYVAIVVSTEV